MPTSAGTCPACRGSLPHAAEILPTALSDVFGIPLGQQTDVRLVAKRSGFFRLLISGFFSCLLVVICLMPGTSAPAYLIAVLSLGIFLLQLAYFVRPPVLELKDGRLYIRRPLAQYNTPADNVIGLHYTQKLVRLTFRDANNVDPAARVAALQQTFQKTGSHVFLPGSFDSPKLESLRRQLHLDPTVAVVADEVSRFNAKLAELTPNVVVVPAIILLNAAIYAAMVIGTSTGLMPDSLAMVEWGGNFGPLTRSGEWWRIVTSMFLHYGIVHLAVNMWVLWDIGRLVERIVGPAGFAVAYLLTGFFGGVASVVWNEQVVSAGASGAVFGVFGVLLGFMAFHRESIPRQVIRAHRTTALAFLILNLVLGFSVKWIDNAAHLGGFGAGVLAGLILSRAVTEKDRSVAVWRAILLSVVGAVACLSFLLLYPQRPLQTADALVLVQLTESKAAEVYFNAVQKLESKTKTPQQAAGRVEEEILPRFDQLLNQLGRVEDDETNRKLMEAIRLQKQGWLHATEAMRQRDLIQEGLALEAWDEASSIMATINQDFAEQSPSNLRGELARLAVVESRVLARYEAAATAAEEGRLSDSEFADLVEKDVLTPYRNVEQRFSTQLKRLRAEEQPIGRMVQQYMEHQARCWQLWIESIREEDPAKALQSHEEQERANELSKKVWGTSE